MTRLVEDSYRDIYGRIFSGSGITLENGRCITTDRFKASMLEHGASREMLRDLPRKFASSRYSGIEKMAMGDEGVQCWTLNRYSHVLSVSGFIVMAEHPLVPNSPYPSKAVSDPYEVCEMYLDFPEDLKAELWAAATARETQRMANSRILSAFDSLDLEGNVDLGYVPKRAGEKARTYVWRLVRRLGNHIRINDREEFTYLLERILDQGSEQGYNQPLFDAQARALVKRTPSGFAHDWDDVQNLRRDVVERELPKLREKLRQKRKRRSAA
jgi:hypothetical protein